MLLTSFFLWGRKMTPKVAQVDVESRARERFNRSKRLRWSILNWQETRNSIGKMLDLLEDALAKTDEELRALEEQLGYKVEGDKEG